MNDRKTDGGKGDRIPGANQSAYEAGYAGIQWGDGVDGCKCEACRPITLAAMRMVLCAKCGNKRCPHATHHDNACTNSNEPGQPGSKYA